MSRGSVAVSPGTLTGRTVMVTRPGGHSSELTRLLEDRGATVLEAPTIQLRPAVGKALERAVEGIAKGRFAWVTLTSRTTVAVLRARLASEAIRARVAAIGEGTAAAYRSWTGRDPDLIPRVFETASLGTSFPSGQGEVLCLRADIAPQGLEDALAAKGWTPRRVTAYRTSLARRFAPDARSALEAGGVDAVTFTSASTVLGFVRALEGPPATALPPRMPAVVSIGPVTANEARRHGMHVAAVARPHTVDGLVVAVEGAVARRRPASIGRR
jgi:uroporphyrinogen-III synthase